MLFLGASHAPDDCFVWFPHERVLYAGSILKEHLGNLAFADLEEYPKTLQRLKMLHLDIATIVSGHWSAVHGPELIDQVLTMLAEHPAPAPTVPIPAAPTGTPSELLAAADDLVVRGEYAEALQALDAYAAGGGDDPSTEALRCWAETGTAAPGGVHSSAEGGFRSPEKVFAPVPQYTVEASRARVQGSARLRLLVDDEGRVACVLILQGLAGGLDTKSVEVVKKWRFRPATVDGVPVTSAFDLTLNFTMQ